MDYYNDVEPYACDWMVNLAAAGHIPNGMIDRRSILDVTSEELAQYRRCHFFAGIAGWALALKLAGWPEEIPVWTGSCPCQPFSICGKKKGEKDERHLWPAFRGLIEKRRPPVVFGEQVASPAGRKWLAGVRADLEGLGYRVGAADLCAASAGEEGQGWILRGDRIFLEPVVVGPPHIRQRLYWVADTDQEGRGFERAPLNGDGRHASGDDVDGRGSSERLGEPGGARLEERSRDQDGPGTVRHEGETVGAGSTGGAADPGRLANTERDGRRTDESERGPEGRTPAGWIGPWSRFDIVLCRDGKARRIESGSAPLAYGVPNRMGKLRAYGNAIVPEVAAVFVEAYLGNLLRRR